MTHSVDSQHQCLQTALRVLGRRDHGIEELKNKLRDKGFTASAITATICECIRLNYLDDARFTTAFVLNSKRRGYGPLRIKQKLLARGIGKTLITATLDVEFDRDQQTMVCVQTLQKKIRAASRRSRHSHIGASQPVPHESARATARLFRFLHARGFSPDIIRHVLSTQQQR